jgi:hypothetical protein
MTLGGLMWKRCLVVGFSEVQLKFKPVLERRYSLTVLVQATPKAQPVDCRGKLLGRFPSVGIRCLCLSQSTCQSGHQSDEGNKPTRLCLITQKCLFLSRGSQCGRSASPKHRFYIRLQSGIRGFSGSLCTASFISLRSVRPTSTSPMGSIRRGGL